MRQPIEMPSKFEEKVIGRLLERLRKGGLDAALEYGIAVCGCNPRITTAVLSNSPEPLGTMLEASFAAQRERQQVAHEQKIERHNESARATKLANETIALELESARRAGQAVIFLATLTTAERAACKATKNEMAAAVDLRRNSLRSTQVKAALQCSDTELKRWSEDGRLPVMFRRRMPSSVGRTLEVRHWEASLVHAAEKHVNLWRHEDLLAKRRKNVAK